jgi:SulP family sulfate permease
MSGYRASWLPADSLGALTLVAVALPSQMATARLANLPAVYGLYAFVAGSLLYALVGTNRHLSVGADSTIAPVLAAGVGSLAVVGTAGYSTLMALTALLVGALLVVVGLLRLGWIAEFLSAPVITGLLAGIAVQIAVRQLPTILGLPAGGTTTLGRLSRVVDQVDHVNGWSLGIALGVLALVVGTQLIDHRLPGGLLALVLSILAVNILHLASHHGVAVIGAVGGGFPHVAWPSGSWTQVRQLATPVLTVAFVCIAQTAATARMSSVGAPAAGDFNRDLIGVGAGSLAAGMIGSFAVDASPPNTAIVTASGARSQAANLLAGIVIFGVVLGATAPLHSLPEAMLGAILVSIAAKLFRVGELRAILRFDRLEFALATITLLAVALTGIEQGVLLAIVLSLADRTRRSARPRDALLGREPGTDHWIPVDVGRRTEQLPGVLVYLFYAPLWYANADYVRLRIRTLVSQASEPVRTFIVDADAISDIDYTGMLALRNVTAELAGEGVKIGIARASHLVHHDLKHGDLLHQLGADHLYVSVSEAVHALSGS